MGESTELIAREWDVQREHQDQLALASHVKAAHAYDAGWYDDLVVPFMDCEEDNNIRRDSTFEKLQALKPVFSSDEGSDPDGRQQYAANRRCCCPYCSRPKTGRT